MAADEPVVREALAAWIRGDLDAFEQFLAQDAELLWYEAGPWNCHGRVAIMRLQRQRQAEGRGAFEVRIDDVDADTLVVSALHPEHRQGSDGAHTATRVTLRDGRIARLQQYRSREEALAAR
jgi:ketosteroid isomerase-like protein